VEFKSVSDQCCCCCCYRFSNHLLGFMSMFVNRENVEWRGPRLLNVALNAFDILNKEVFVLSYCSLTDSCK